MFYPPKHQGAIETSTYGAEFNDMKTAVEEIISIRYMLGCLGVWVAKETKILGKNRSVILNATVPSLLLKKKHVAISYHLTQECTAAGISLPLKTRDANNYSDLLTKAVSNKPFAKLLGRMVV